MMTSLTRLPVWLRLWAKTSPLQTSLIALVIVSTPAPGQAPAARPAGQQELPVTWPYTDFGTPGRVVTRKEDRELGAAFVTFENGSRLAVKQTPFEKNRVYIDVALGSGRAGAPPDLVHALWATEFLTTGGTGKLSQIEIERWLHAEGRLASAQLSAGPRTFNLLAKTRPDDLASQMQILAAYARDPGFRSELATQLAQVGPKIAMQIEANASHVFEREAAQLFGGGSLRYSKVPGKRELAVTRAANVEGLLRFELAGAADVTVVGDIDVDTAIAAVSSTFGAGLLPSRSVKIPVPVRIPQGGGQPYIVAYNGSADQAIYGIFWALPDYHSDPQQSHVAEIVAAVLGARLLDTVGARMKAALEARANADPGTALPGQGFLSVSIQTLPPNFDLFHSLLEEELTNIANKGITADELERVRRQLLEASQGRRESNAWWIANLASIWREPLVRTRILTGVKGLKNVRAEDVQAFVSKSLIRQTPSVVIAKPK